MSDRLKKWASELTREQLEQALVDMTQFAIDSEWISFYSDSLVPYYSTCGEPLVEGQKCFEDEDDE